MLEESVLDVELGCDPEVPAESPFWVGALLVGPLPFEPLVPCKVVLLVLSSEESLLPDLELSVFEPMLPGCWAL